MHDPLYIDIKYIILIWNAFTSDRWKKIKTLTWRLTLSCSGCFCLYLYLCFCLFSYLCLYVFLCLCSYLCLWFCLQLGSKRLVDEPLRPPSASDITWKLKSVYILLFHLHYWKASFSQIEICEAKYVNLKMSNISEDVCWSIVLTCFYTAPIPFIKLYDRSMWGENQDATQPHNAELSILQFCKSETTGGSALQYFSGSVQFFRDPLEQRPTISGISNKCKSSNFPQINPIQSLLQPSVSWPSDILMGQNMLMVATKMAISLAKIYFWCRRKDIIHQSKNGQQISKPKTTDVLKCYNYFFSSLLFWLHRHERGRRMTR